MKVTMMVVIIMKTTTAMMISRRASEHFQTKWGETVKLSLSFIQKRHNMKTYRGVGLYLNHS
jgi:hypothetical protein